MDGSWLEEDCSIFSIGLLKGISPAIGCDGHFDGLADGVDEGGAGPRLG